MKTKTRNARNRIAALATNGDGRSSKRSAEKREERAKREAVKVIPLREKIITVRIVGTSPYMQSKFSKTNQQKIMDTQSAGQQAKSKRRREPRNYEKDYEGATHFFEGGREPGIPASAFRNALISACKLVGFHMTKAKCAIFAEADGVDDEGTGLVKIEGKREMSLKPGRNADFSCDIRSRPIWKKWAANLRLRFDEDQFSVSDVINLLIRVGAQIGIGEGRHDSKKSNGIGYGCFSVKFAEGAGK